MYCLLLSNLSGELLNTLIHIGASFIRVSIECLNPDTFSLSNSWLTTKLSSSLSMYFRISAKLSEACCLTSIFNPTSSNWHLDRVSISSFNSLILRYWYSIACLFALIGNLYVLFLLLSSIIRHIIIAINFLNQVLISLWLSHRIKKSLNKTCVLLYQFIALWMLSGTMSVFANWIAEFFGWL